MRLYYPVLTVAGSDSSGGAGIQADIKTISAIGCYAMSAITAITVQNTTGVAAVQGIESAIVEKQITTVCSDIPPLAVKTGMLFNAEVTAAVARTLKACRCRNIVIDPVMVSTSGSKLIDDDAVDVLVKELFPLAAIVTPNRSEAIALTGEEAPEAQAAKLHEMGCVNVVVKGGDSNADPLHKVDYVSLYGGTDAMELKADAVATANTHGTGCTFSAAIASWLALGANLEDAVVKGKLFVTRALEAGAFITCGKGHGPVNHFFSPRRLKNYNPNR